MDFAFCKKQCDKNRKNGQYWKHFGNISDLCNSSEPNIVEFLLDLDYSLFELINQRWDAAWLDAIMPYWRSKYTWIPLYVLLLGYLLYRYRWRGLYLMLALVATVGVSDTMSSKVVKKTVQRIRPCNDVEVKAEVDLLISCGGGYSFTSSHATNHFAVAVFLIITLGRVLRWLRWPLILWAASIAYGQVYVGVHYPLDVLGGALLGGSIGFLMAQLYWRWQRIAIPA